MKKTIPLALALGACLLLGGFSAALAAPRWERPGLLAERPIDEKTVTYFVSPEGDDARDGRSRATAFATMQKAADLAGPGETVLVLRGVYPRGFHVHKEGRADAWITLLAEPGVEIRGSDRETGWTLADPEKKLYTAPLPDLHGWQTPETALQQRREQVFVDGRLLSQVPQKEMLKPRGVFYADDAAKLLWVCLKDGDDPNRRQTEVTRRTWAIQVGAPPNRNWWHESAVSEARRSAYIRISGFRVRNVATFSRQAAISVRGLCHDIVIENCDVQWSNSIGIEASSLYTWSPVEQQWIYCPVENVTIRHCVASHCGVQGIGGGPHRFLVESNLMDDNNYKDVSPWSEGGACKTGFDGRGIVVRNNVARNNNNHGLWFDYAGEGGVFENNFVYNSVAGAILNEVTPTPGNERSPGGKLTGKEPKRDEAQARVTRGTIIRNNVLVGTRPPGGGGINVSSSCDTEVYNNVLVRNNGAAIHVGGSPTRPHTAGLHRNRVRSNICFENFYNASLLRDEDDAGGRTFGNVFESNLFIRPRGSAPFNVSGQPASREVFDQANRNARNFYADASPFANPDRFDFTLADAAAATAAGFDPGALRLDWSEFYAAPPKTEKRRRNLSYFPIDLTPVFNRALADETPGDGKGGWTDQGKNDMRLFPAGRQSFDGIEYAIGSLENGAVMLASPHVKTERPLPRTVPIAVGARFDSLFFLYTAAWAGDEKKNGNKLEKVPNPVAAEMTVRYGDGTVEKLPFVVGRHVVDWWTDPSWQQFAALNDNQVYSAWQGPNPAVARVIVLYRQWDNPHPDKEIKEIILNNIESPIEAAFALLGVTGARPQTSRAGGIGAFRLSYDGDMDATGSGSEPIEPLTEKSIVYSAGKFEPGRDGKAYRPAKVVAYPVPGDFPLQGEGTLSMWLKADDWTAPERVKRYRSTDYARTMTPFSAESAPQKWSPWQLSFQVDPQDPRILRMAYHVSGIGLDKIDVTDRIASGRWFHVAVVWQPDPGRSGHTVTRAYLDGREIASKSGPGRAELIGAKIYPAIPSNGGQPWAGLIEELEILKKALTPDEIAQRQTGAAGSK